MTFLEKMNDFTLLITKEKKENLIKSNLACASNMANATAEYKKGTKYYKIIVGGGASFMVDVKTEEIFGVKGYGQVHLGHRYGTLDTIDDFNWGEYYPVRKNKVVKTAVKVVNNKIQIQSKPQTDNDNDFSFDNSCYGRNFKW